MMLRKTTVTSRTAATALLLLTAACGGGSDTPTSPTPTGPPTVASIAISGYSSPFTAIGQTATLKATATMSDGATQDVTGVATWASDAAGVARVNTSGVVISVSPGDATITATHSGRQGASRVSVSPPREAQPSIVVDFDVVRSPEPNFLFRANARMTFREMGGSSGYSVNFVNTTFRDSTGSQIGFRNFNPTDFQRFWGNNYVKAGETRLATFFQDYNRIVSSASVLLETSITDDLGNTRFFSQVFQGRIQASASVDELRGRDIAAVRFSELQP